MKLLESRSILNQIMSFSIINVNFNKISQHLERDVYTFKIVNSPVTSFYCRQFLREIYTELSVVFQNIFLHQSL